ncbi:QueT transporter family protein [Gemella sp. GH3]|uniref:QueT transporter family protein n=1 Tax=unclassified Gemella TaxID=2624949 RepID=UPI0015D02EFD|nr:MULTISPECIES: QueT transporter family protein [unclassified Gemella]MBF0713495.1 QueT transporter family protein [Gemella sp. GH3.1]NYS50447.1 QueT transporter family protein [Gemella sp. GH3]
MRNNKIKILTVQALITAIYVVLTISNLSFSYGSIQFRFSESLTQLVVFNKLFWLPLTLGVAIANLFSPLGLVDVFFGTLGTGLALFISICIFKFIKNRIIRHIINIVIYLIVCMPIIAYEIAVFSGDNGSKIAFDWNIFLSIYGGLLLSQIIVMVIGVVLTEILHKTINLEKIFKK